MITTSCMTASGRLAAIALVALTGCSTLAAGIETPTAARSTAAAPSPTPPSAAPETPAEPAATGDSAPPPKPVAGNGQDATASSASTASRHRVETAEPDSFPPNDLTPQILFQLLASEIAAQRGQVGSAAATYLSLAEQTRDPRLARRATELALAERSLDRAQQAAQLWYEVAPQSVLAAQTLESLWLSVGNFTDAEPLVVARLAKAREGNAVDEFYQQITRTLLRSASKPGALALFDRISTADAERPEVRLSAAALAHTAGLHERAAADAAAALKVRPDDERTVVNVARFVGDSAAGSAGAAKVLAQFLARMPDSTEARFQYARLLATQGKPEAAREQMELALKTSPDNPAILFSLAQIAYQTKQLPVAEDYLNRFVQLPPSIRRDNGPAYLFLAQIEEDRGRPERAIAHLAHVTRGDQLVPAVTRRALLLAKLGRVDEARALLAGTDVATSAERMQLTLAESNVLREVQRFDDAFVVLDKALERSPDNPDLLYDHAMAAERLNRIDLVEKSLRRLIELRPDNSHAYNALGYTLADRNMKLEEAQALIEKAIQISPDDVHIIDSMGWVLFRRGRFEEALTWLERAFKTKPDAETAAHLGEVLWAMGRRGQARKVWAQAQGREPDNTTLRDTLARLNVAL